MPQTVPPNHKTVTFIGQTHFSLCICILCIDCGNRPEPPRDDSTSVLDDSLDTTEDEGEEDESEGEEYDSDDEIY